MHFMKIRGIIHFSRHMFTTEIVFSMNRAFEKHRFCGKGQNMSRNVCLSEDIQIMPFSHCTEEHREHLPIVHRRR